jgi:hypothetical protein
MVYPTSWVRTRPDRTSPDWSIGPNLGIVVLERHGSRRQQTGVSSSTELRVIWRIYLDELALRGDLGDPLRDTMAEKVRTRLVHVLHHGGYSALSARHTPSRSTIHRRRGVYGLLKSLHWRSEEVILTAHHASLLKSLHGRSAEVILTAHHASLLESLHGRSEEVILAADHPSADTIDRPALEWASVQSEPELGRRASVGFIPSETLVSFWKRGLNSHISEFALPSLFDKVKGLSARADYGSLADAFAKKLTRMIAVLANRQRHQIQDYHLFSQNGRFSVSIQHNVLDRFPIIPDEATDFFGLLHEEIVTFLQNGGLLQGSWGKLSLKGNSLVLRSEKTESSTIGEKWKRANVLE